MSKRTNGTAVVATAQHDVTTLYVEFLKHFYERDDRKKATIIATKLDCELAASAELADSILGEEIRSLLAEFRGDFKAAIDSRQTEIRKILELHTLTVNTPQWPSISRHYDFSDVSDRLDLLALLYDQQGDQARALATLRESQRYCASHGIRFDGQDLLDELENDAACIGRAKRASAKVRRSRKRNPVQSRA